MMGPVCHIVSAGDVTVLPRKREGDLVIACDAGLLPLKEAGIEPDVFVGDGDSLGYIPDGMKKVTLPCEKDDTDTLAAIKYGVGAGFSKFALYGALGGDRFSHSIANLRCLSYIAERGGEGAIYDSRCFIRLISQGEEFSFENEGGYFSLFPLNPDAVVTVRGAKYPLDAASLPYSGTLGVSNETRGRCTVSVRGGAVAIICEPGDNIR